LKGGDNVLKVIGQPNCTQCMLVKKLLGSKKIEYTYQGLEELQNKEEQIEKAKENGVFTLPIIIEDGKYLSVNQLIEKIKKTI